MLGLRVILIPLKLVHSKSKLRPGPVGNPSKRANHRPIPVGIRQGGLEARRGSQIGSSGHRGAASWQEVQTELRDGVPDERSLTEVEAFTTTVPSHFDAENGIQRTKIGRIKTQTRVCPEQGQVT